MKLFTVKAGGEGLVEIALEPFEQEGKLEDWIEENPSELLGLAGETLLTIGRQVGTDFGVMDILCLDINMTPIVVELKKERAPRDVVAQALEYTTWVASQDYDIIARQAAEYLKCPLADAFWKAFQDSLAAESDSESELAHPTDDDLRNRFEQARVQKGTRIFIVAGDIPERTRAVARFLRQYNLDVTCLSVQQSVKEEPRILGVSEMVGGQVGPKPAPPSPTPDQVIERIYSASAELGKLFECLCAGTRQLQPFSEKSGVNSVTYQLKLPESSGPRSVVRYSLYSTESLVCTLWHENLAKLVSLDKPKLIQALQERFEPQQVIQGSREINIPLKQQADADAWLEILRGLFSENI